MADTTRLIRLVVDQNSPDNNVRKAAELSFAEYVRANPSTAAFELIMAATVPENQLPVDIRQASLLHLKRLVPKYWSLAFQLFVGPPIEQDLKAMIRQNLILLVTSSPHSKIRLSSAYVIVQIAAADYPDEWPELLPRLYEQALKYDDPIAISGSLTVLTDLFDDLITEEMFWEGGIGNQFLSHLTNLLSQNQLGSAVKVSALNLYLTVFSTLLSSEARQLKERLESVNGHIIQFSGLLLSLVRESLATAAASPRSLSLIDLKLRFHVYKTLTQIAAYFPRVLPTDTKKDMFKILIEDFVTLSHVFKSLLVNQDNSISIVKSEDASEPEFCINNLVSNLLDLLSHLQEKLPLYATLPEDTFSLFMSSLIIFAEIPVQTLEDYEADFNRFVTDSTGLSGSVSIRDSILEFLSNSNENDVASIFHAVNRIDNSADYKLKEACLFVIEGVFLNEKLSTLGQEFSASAYLSQISALTTTNHPFVTSRAFLLIPRLMDKFHNQIAVASFASVELRKMLEYSKLFEDQDQAGLVIASALISVTLWKNIEGFDLSLVENSLQDLIFELCNRLVDDSDEDTLPVLIEAISAAISISDERAQGVNIAGSSFSVMELILNISFKDSANIQLIVDATECIELFLEDLSVENYLLVCEKSVPFLMHQVSSSLQRVPIEFSPDLSLQLEILCIIITQFPLEKTGQQFPPQLFSCVFPDTSKLIMNTNDDQILQKAGELFNAVIQKASSLVVEFKDPVSGGSGTDLLLTIASKFLSPELSDSAAMTCGLTVISLFENFQKYLNDDFFFQLLQATVRRLVIAKSIVTIENLIMVFCKLVLNTSPEIVIQALTSMDIADSNDITKNGLELVMPIWLNNFEVTRGFEKIKQNVLALGKIFSLGDSRLEQLTVNGELIPYDGDLIITRSMAKSMPEKYTQVPAPQKILLLLAGELAFQCQQPDPTDFLPEEGDEGDDEGDWEEMDDLGVPNFETLKSYVDSDDEDEPLSQDSGIKEILVQFFKECLTKNLGNFREHYEALGDDDKKIITENVVF